MAAPVIQFKKGQFANLPGLRKGEPGFTTDFYDLYIGINSTTDGNKFFGSHRYWKRETTTSGSGIRLVEGTDNGSGDITVQAPGTISGLTTYTMPTSGSLNQFLKISSIESSDDGNFDCTLGFDTVTTDVVADTSPQLGGDLDLNSNDITGTGNLNISGIVTATTFSGSGASLTSIPNTSLNNSTVSYGGVELSLGGSDATPAFDLSDATNYPFTSLTGIATDILGDTSPQLGGDLDLNSNDITGTGNLNITGGIDVTGIITAPNYHGGRYNQFIAGLDAGGSTGVGSTSIETIIAIGSSAAKDFGDTTDSIGDGRLVVIGHNTLSNELGDNRTSRYSRSVVIGNNTLDRATSCTDSTIIGDNIGSGLTNPTVSTLIGSSIGTFKLGSDDGRSYAGNISIGHASMIYNDGVTEFNTVMGYQAASVRNGSYNIFLGYKAGQSHINGNSSIGIGYVALGRVSGGNGNIGIGSEAGFAPASSNLSGEGNVFIGRKAGYGASTVSGNVVLIGGYSDQPVNIPISDGDNQLVIGAGATAWFYGDRSYNIGIGTTSPTEKLDVIGTVKATSFIKNGGASTEFLKADGSVDTNTYITSADGGDAATLDGIDSTSFLRSDAADTKTSGNLTFNDSIQARFGNNSDLRISHDGTDNHIMSADKDLSIELSPDGGTPKLYLRPTTSHQGITLGGGSGNPVELYHNNTKTLETTSSGVTVTGGTLVSAASTFSGNLDISGNAIVTGNLTVNGTTTQLNTTQTTVEDVLLELQVVNGSAPSSDTNKDVGIVMNYFLDSAKKAALYWDDSVGRIVAADDVSETSGVLTPSTYAAFEIGSLYLNDCAGASQVISCSGTTRSLENITIDAGTF